MTMTLEQFLRLLPAARKLEIAVAPSEYARHGIEDPAPFPAFVPPTLKRVSEEEATPSVLLVSAPGAVGKTTLAREIARSTGSPLWHLGQVNVGHEFLSGAIARAFGDGEYSRIKRELVNRQRALVFDGLDEARLRAGEQNFEAFLERLADDFRTPGQCPALILLGRSDIVTDTAIWFELLGVPTARYEIEYFDRAAAVDFIGKYLDANSKKKPHRQAGDQFAKARDAVLDRLETAVPATVDPRSLAGYAPVLALVSEILDVGNPYAEFQAILRESEKWRLETLVSDIAMRLLTREHNKTVGTLATELASLTSGAFQWSNAYQPDEQCLRLLAFDTGHTLADPPPSDLPTELREPYERQLKRWVGDHPFTAQPLFMDYAYAWLFTRERADSSLSGSVRTRLCRTKDRRPPYRPTPLLAWFAADFAAGNAAQRQLRMNAEDFGFVYESALAAATSQDKPQLTLVSSEEGEEIIGEFSSGNMAERRGQRLSIRLRDQGSGLWFWRRLLHADIQTSQQIRIGAADTEFLLGPAVVVEAGSFACDSAYLRVLAPTQEMAVLLTAQAYVGAPVELLGSHSQRLHLGVSWMPRQHPWAPYVIDVDPTVPMSPEIKENFRRLRRILVWFRAEGHGELARHQDLLDNPAVAGSGRGRDMLNYCIKQGLIRRERPMYVLDRAELDRLGINWSDIQQRRITQANARFLEGFLRDNH